MSIGRLPLPSSDAPAPAVIPLSPTALSTGFGVAEPEAGVDWRRVMSAVLRYKWLICGVTLLGTVAGFGAGRFFKPQFAAQATIWIDAGERRGDNRRDAAGPIRQGQLLDAQAWVDLLKSYVVLDQVVRDQQVFLSAKVPADAGALADLRVTDQYRPGVYRLTVDSERRAYTLATDKGEVLERGTVGEAVGTRLGFAWTPSPNQLPGGRTVEFALSTVRDAARSLADSLNAQLDLEGNFLKLELRGPDAPRITALVNAVAQRYVLVAADLKRTKLTELTKILAEQLQSAQDNLRSSEAALERFRERTITLPTDRPPPVALGAAGGAGGGAPATGQSDPTFGTFFNLQFDRERAQQDREALQRLLAEAGDSGGISADALAVVGPVQSNPDLAAALTELTSKRANLRALRYRYSEQYPPVQRLVGDIATLERQTIPALARGLIDQLKAREADLDRRIGTDSRSLRQIPARAIEEARLRRGVSMTENLYTMLQQRFEEARLAEASTIPDVRILDAAVVSREPVKQMAGKLILLGFCGSFGLALVGAVLLDRVDPRVRYPDQVSREMGLAILGAVPHLRTLPHAGRHGRSRVPEDVNQVVEALRGVCLNLVYAHGGRAPLLVTITSPGAGDGKSFLAANLAHTFADGGHRTLLIDADIRRGVLHRRLNARRRPGLSDFLRGETPLDSIVQATPYPSLSLIGCGTRAYNAPEMLGSPAMSELVNGMRSGYDVILIDSPPLAAGVDPLILSTLTGTLALVLRTGYSHREVAAAKLEMLQRLPVRLLGAILNDVPAGGAYRYYSYYLPGYEAADEDSGGRRVPV
jgi:capsular exopolysaccharide synthesis family protein